MLLAGPPQADTARIRERARAFRMIFFIGLSSLAYLISVIGLAWLVLKETYPGSARISAANG